MTKKLDVLFVSPNSAKAMFQGLADKASAIEMPYWACLLAESCRTQGYSVAILDTLAEHLTTEQSIKRIREIDPRLVCFVTYGSNPNQGITNFENTYDICYNLKQNYSQYKTMAIGTLSSSVPHQVLGYGCFDFVSYNEGVKCLHQLLATDLETDLHKIKALGYIKDGLPYLNSGVDSLVTTEEMDRLMPNYALDLLPFKNQPLDLYRSHDWLALYQDKNRTPAAAIASSLGCRFSCNFCHINIVNRTETVIGTHAAHSNIMRFWSVEKVLSWFDMLVQKYNCYSIRLVDEMFCLSKQYYTGIVNGLKQRDYAKDLRLFCYGRVDSINTRFLDDFRQAGFLWYGIGIESSEQSVRQEIDKGRFKDVNIREIVKQIKNAGSFCGNNYIFGLTGDDSSSMQKTLDLSMELNGEFNNYYPCHALYGSPLYYDSLEKGYELPKTWSAWSFHSYDCQPLPTEHLTAAEILKFRDESWHKYYGRTEYQEFIRGKFGDEAANHIKELCKIKLSRKLLGHPAPN